MFDNDLDVYYVFVLPWKIDTITSQNYCDRSCISSIYCNYSLFNYMSIMHLYTVPTN